MPMKRPALFLDRDGVLIENCSNYVRSWADVEILPGAIEALAAVREAPWHIVLVTNQSAVGRGLISYNQVESINNQFLSTVSEAGGRIDATYICPHSPDAGCDCRKPRPGLLLRAAKERDIALAQSIMIGDALTDIQAGQAAGVRSAVLLRTGRGAEQERLPAVVDLPPFLVFDTLAAALATIDLPLAKGNL
jgi:D-glycero-D-manno-heptose 1,7-bisphosphate phosphatase